MDSVRLFAAFRPLAVAALVFSASACSMTRESADDYSRIFAVAEADVGAGRVDAAIASFDRAAMADPTRKEPWLRMAQLQFDAGNYGRAIVAAEEVLQRDPDDPVADSVLTVAGLRIASQSLQRLEGNGALASATARTEAERLAHAMRDTMGEAILGSAEPEAPARRATPRRRATQPTPEPKRKPTVANPFGALGG